MRQYGHLRLEEREKLFAWKEVGLPLREIARRLLRHPATISREISRNTWYGRPYLPCRAQRRYERVTKEQRRQAPLKNPEIFLYVREKLREYWTPEIISGRIGLDIREATIDPETIYRYIYCPTTRKDKLWEYLPNRRKKRMKKLGRRVQKRGKVPNAVSIDLRPRSILRRKQPGHWETDNMAGIKTSRPALSVTVERVTRIVVISKVPNQTSEAKTKALALRLSHLPLNLRQSLTQDNGKENYGHEETQAILGIGMYFCHAYHSWEKGSVENRIGRIRRFLPKGTDLTPVSKETIRQIEDQLNHLPMKCLGFRTPYEKMQQLMTKVRSA